MKLREFVDNLIQLVPVPPETINATVEEDLTSIVEIEKLRITEIACEDTYPTWSARASDVIRQSEIGTVDRRNFEDFLADNTDPPVSVQQREMNAHFQSMDLSCC
jgi:hypothetical protein